MKKLIKILFTIFIVILFSFWTIRPLLVPGFFPMHDNTQPARVYQMAKALSFGQFPVRWVPDLGYGFGYPLFNFYAPLPYYIGGIFKLIGFEAIIATKIMFAIGVLFAGVSMYFLGREIAGSIAGFASAMLYMYAPYHAVNIYVRGAVGEFYAYGFLPLLFLGIYLIVNGSFKKGIVIGSLGFSAILLSHNILGLIVGFFLIFGLILFSLTFLFSSPRESHGFSRHSSGSACHSRGGFKALLVAILLGFGLSAFFVLPALVEKKYTKVEELTAGGSNFQQHFVYPDQLWDSPWGFAGSAPGRADGMSFKIGKFHLILGLISVLFAFYLYKNKRLNNFQLSTFNFQLSIFLISVFLILEQSKLFWQILPFFSYIQYPWRFLNFTIFSLAVLIGALFVPFKKLAQITLGILIVGATLLLNIKYFVPKEYSFVKPEDYTGSVSLRFKISKISDEYMPKEFSPPQNADEAAWQGISETNDLEIKDVQETPTQKRYQIVVFKPTKITTNIAFFPGWRAYLNKEEIEVKNNQGRVRLNIPSGSHSLVLDFKNTPIRSLGNTISIFSLFLLVYSVRFGKFNPDPPVGGEGAEFSVSRTNPESSTALRMNWSRGILIGSMLGMVQ